MKTLPTIVLALVLCITTTTIAKAQSNKIEQQIANDMQAQTLAWNAGNLEAFMEVYWKSEKLVFVGSSGPVYGWQQTLDNYKKSYNSKAKMGKLVFNLIDFKPLGKKHYRVIGQWHLTREVGDVGGYFTLVFEKIKGKWLIISDHSS